MRLRGNTLIELMISVAILGGMVMAASNGLLTPSRLKQDWTWPFLGPMHLKPRRLAALVGFHSPAGARDGFRAHTINDAVRGLRINGQPAGEVVHLMMGLAALKVPVVLVSGDHHATAEAARLVPGVQQVAVRWRDSQGQPRFLSSEEAGRRLQQAAQNAARAALEPAQFSQPLLLELELHSARAVAGRTTCRPKPKRASPVPWRCSSTAAATAPARAPPWPSRPAAWGGSTDRPPAAAAPTRC